MSHPFLGSNRHSQSAFTLIELLVVIAIITILAVVVVLTLNPAQLLAQSRDANRVSDMATLNSAINLYETDQSGASSFSLGSSSVIYVSIPDLVATSTAGDACQGLGLLTLPSGYTYHCAATSTFRNTFSTGWIPINFSQISAGAPFGSLPIDPVNNSSSRLYYTYETNGSQFETTAVMESQKYQLGGSNDQIASDGGILASVYEKGSQLGLEPLDYGDTSLVGYWPLNEGSGNVAYDDSGNNATGSWSGTPIGTSGYYSPGKIGPWAGTFDGSSTVVTLPPSFTGLVVNQVTLSVWVKGLSPVNWISILGGGYAGNSGLGLMSNGRAFFILENQSNEGSVQPLTPTSTATQWVNLVGTYDGSNMRLYLNGAQIGTAAMSGSIIFSGFNIGYGGYGRYNGLIDDVRIYNRALTAAQIAAMYRDGR